MHANHTMQVVVHLKYFLLLSSQLVGLVVALIHHGKAHRTRYKDVVASTRVIVWRMHLRLDVIVALSFDLGKVCRWFGAVIGLNISLASGWHRCVFLIVTV